MYITAKRLFYLGMPTLFATLLYRSNFSSLVKLIGIAIMSAVFLVAVIIIELNSVKKKQQNITKKTTLEWIALFCIVIFMFGFFATLFLGIINIYQIIAFEISMVFLLLYMILEVCFTINKIIENKKVEEENSQNSCKIVILCLTGAVLMWFFSSDIFKPLHNEVVILQRNILIVFTNFLLLSFCINIIFAFSLQNNKNILAMKLFFASVLLMITVTISFFIWFDRDIASGLVVILSGIVGGILTLLGVLWTIKREEQVRKDDEKNKSKPYLILIQNPNDADISMKKIRVTDLEINDNIFSSFVTASENESTIIINDINLKKIFSFKGCIIKNSENAICVVKGMEIDNTFMKFKKPFLLDKNERFCLFDKDIWFNVKNEDFVASIIVADTNGNNYSISLGLMAKTESIQRKESTRLVVSVGTVYVINEIGLPFDYLT